MKKKILSLLTCLSIILIGIFTVAGCAENPADTNIYVTTNEELVTAVSEAPNGSKIVLKNDIDLSQQLVVTTTLTLDLNGKEISNTTDIWNTATGAWSLISIQGNGDLTITGNGFLNAKENDCYAIDVRDTAKVTIKNGEVTGNVTAVYVIDNGFATIEGGTYNIKQLSTFSDNRYTLNALDEDNQDATFLVTGGTFVKYDPSHSNSENPELNFVADGYEANLVGENYVVSKIAE